MNSENEVVKEILEILKPYEHKCSSDKGVINPDEVRNYLSDFKVEHLNNLDVWSFNTIEAYKDFRIMYQGQCVPHHYMFDSY